MTSSPYSKITKDKLAWDICEVTSESGHLPMLETLVKLLTEEDNGLSDWYTVNGEQVSVGGKCYNETLNWKIEDTDFYAIKSSANNLNSEIGPFLSFQHLLCFKVSKNATVHATRPLGSIKLDFWGILLVNAKDKHLCVTPDERKCMNAYVLAPTSLVYIEF
ncbi:hypothetical protein FQA39_LY03363 [Lamprigera yunnana]|nr:hypothetical protein FQA39_LY03363 [Lamprigera yunnana]